MSYIHLFLYCNPTQVILPYSCILPMKPSYSKVTCVLLQLSLRKSVVILRRMLFIIIVVPSFYSSAAMLVIVAIPHRFYLWPALFFSSLDRRYFQFIFQLPIAQAISFVSLGRSSHRGCNFTQDNAGFPPLPCCCNRPQVAIASSFRLQFPAGNRCLFHRTRLSICAGSTLLLK